MSTVSVTCTSTRSAAAGAGVARTVYASTAPSTFKVLGPRSIVTVTPGSGAVVPVSVDHGPVPRTLRARTRAWYAVADSRPVSRTVRCAGPIVSSQGVHGDVPVRDSTS